MSLNTIMFFFRRILVLIIFVFSTITFSQTIIKGKVIDDKKDPLEGAAVYINNTTFGTFTDKNGEFKLKITEGQHTLIVSFLGYKTLRHTVITSNYKKSFLFELKIDSNVLDEVVIKNTVYNSDWKFNLSKFKKAFLGNTNLSKNCVILNPKTLSFTYDFKMKTFTASARKPLRIKNKDLGYLITYDLIDFTIEDQKLTYLGYVKYQHLKKRLKKRWIKNRLKAYNGSRMHFLRSVRTKSLKKEGFIVHQFKRVKNPARPTDKEIKAARQFIILSGGKFNHTKITHPKTAIDSANVVLQKSRLPKYRDYLYKSNVSYSDMMYVANSIVFLQFKDYLSIIYTKEPEEINYATRSVWKKREPLNVQTSAITMTQKKVIIDLSGDVVDPLAIFVEGYWAYESFAELLPLNYLPANKD